MNSLDTDTDTDIERPARVHAVRPAANAAGSRASDGDFFGEIALLGLIALLLVVAVIGLV